MSAQYTREQFTAAMEAAVAERGEDFVYPDAWRQLSVCHYSLEDGTPACIIGMALSKLGAPVPVFESVLSADDALVGIVDVDTARAASSAQWAQDRGEPWGKALEDYYAALARIETAVVE